MDDLAVGGGDLPGGVADLGPGGAAVVIPAPPCEFGGCWVPARHRIPVGPQRVYTWLCDKHNRAVKDAEGEW